MYTIEEVISIIADTMEVLPRDVSAKEIKDVVNDALAHLVVETNNTTYFSKFILKSYLEMYDRADEIAYNLSENYDIDKEGVIEILTEYKLYQEEMIQQILIDNIKNLLMEYFHTTPTPEENTDVNS